MDNNEKIEQIKEYIDYMTDCWIKFYHLSKGIKTFKFDPIEDIDKISEHMNNILNSIEFDSDVDIDVKKFIRDYKLEKILENEKN